MNKKNFKKIDLIKIISKQTGYSQNFSKKILYDLLSILNMNIASGFLNLKNIGSFKLLNKKKRVGRNPKTKEEHIITERKSVSFKASKEVTKYLSESYE